MTGQWEMSDAWVFAAIQGHDAADGMRLRDIIFHADYLNHAVLEEHEFCRAVPRLLAVDLIGADRDADRYWRTAAGQELFDRRMKRRGAFGWIDAIPPALRRLGEPRDSEWTLPPGAFATAVQDYLDEFARRMRERERRRRPKKET